MSEDKKEAPQADDTKTQPADAELAESDLGEVAGGLNPQPLPPGFRLPT
jgi:hypothetical protein